MMARNIITTCTVALIIALCASTGLQAQPEFSIARIVNHWPTIEVYFSPLCDGQYTALPKAKLHLFEEGIEVSDFSLWCADELIPAKTSVSLVFDASGSMIGPRNAAAKSGGLALIQEMDGAMDEAAVIWFTSVVNVQLGMTTDKTDLADAVNALPSNGSSALWDGIYLGIQELILSGQNPARGVLVLTDGSENSSSHTRDEIIALASRNRVRVYTVCLEDSTMATQLREISSKSGGKYYFATVDNVDSIMVDAYELLRRRATADSYCLLTYQATCQDGGMREVKLVTDTYCNATTGSDTVSYRAPRDTSTFLRLNISLGDTVAVGGKVVTVPLNLVTPINPTANLYPATVDIKYDSDCLVFYRLTTPPGSLWEYVAKTVTPINGGIRIQTFQPVAVNGTGLLAGLEFQARKSADSVTCPVTIASWKFDQGCFKPVTANANVLIIPAPVTATPGRIICEGDSVTLAIQASFPYYRWNTGSTDSAIVVKSSGTYYARIFDGTDSLTSETVRVTVIGGPAKPIIEGDTLVCENSDAEYTVPGLDENLDVNWRAENGAVQSTVGGRATVGWFAGQPGRLVMTYGNQICVDSVVLSVAILPAPVPDVVVITDTIVCQGDSAILQSAQVHSAYLWSDGSTERTIFVTEPGTYRLKATYGNGCEVWSREYHVSIKTAPAKPVVTQSGNTLTCSVPGNNYQWYKNGTILPGATGRTLVITEPARYYVAVTNFAGCSSYSSELVYTGIGRYAPGLARTFTVAPNPGRGEFEVALVFERPETFTLRIVNVTGKEVYALRIDQPVESFTHTLQLSDTPPGMYMMMLTSGGVFDYRKIIIQPH